MKVLGKDESTSFHRKIRKSGLRFYMFMFFVTVLQKENLVYECQEYQTLDANMQTLDLTFVCRELAQPYKKGLGT